ICFFRADDGIRDFHVTGVQTCALPILAMTRFDCMVGSSAGQRAAVVQALHHCSMRSAFGKLLNQQPLMRNVLADLVLETEGSLRSEERRVGREGRSRGWRQVGRAKRSA